MLAGFEGVGEWLSSVWRAAVTVTPYVVGIAVLCLLGSLFHPLVRAWWLARAKMWLRLHAGGYWWFQRSRRHEPPFRLYTGRRGRGKSLLATRDLQKELARGSLVFSNYPVADPLSMRSAVNFETIDDLMTELFRAVLRGESRIVVGFDEAQNHFDSRDWESFPAWLRTFLAESRHYKVGVIAATQSMSQVDKRFRLLCDEVWRVEPVIESLKHRFALFRLQALDEARNSADDDERQVGRARLSWVVGRAFAGYSTVGLPTAQTVSDADREAMLDLIQRMRDHVSRPAFAEVEAESS